MDMNNETVEKIVSALQGRPEREGITLREIKQMAPHDHDEVIASLESQGIIEFIGGMAHYVGAGQPSHTVTDNDIAYFRGENFPV